MKIVDLSDGRFIPLQPGTAYDLPAVGGEWEPLDMAEPNVVEEPESKIDGAVLDLVAEAFAEEDEPAHPVAELSSPPSLDWTDPPPDRP